MVCRTCDDDDDDAGDVDNVADNISYDDKQTDEECICDYDDLPPTTQSSRSGYNVRYVQFVSLSCRPTFVPCSLRKYLQLLQSSVESTELLMLAL